MNSKSWNKTLESGEVWEYINENRELYKKFSEFPEFEIDKIVFYEDIISIYITNKVSDIKKESNQKNDTKNNLLGQLEELIIKRKRELPPNSYTTNLFEKGLDKILKKLGEESIELILASKDSREETIYETADLLYHIMVLLVYKGIPFDEILKELANRMEK